MSCSNCSGEEAPEVVHVDRWSLLVEAVSVKSMKKRTRLRKGSGCAASIRERLMLQLDCTAERHMVVFVECSGVELKWRLMKSPAGEIVAAEEERSICWFCYYCNNGNDMTLHALSKQSAEKWKKAASFPLLKWGFLTELLTELNLRERLFGCLIN